MFSISESIQVKDDIGPLPGKKASAVLGMFAAGNDNRFSGSKRSGTQASPGKLVLDEREEALLEHIQKRSHLP